MATNQMSWNVQRTVVVLALVLPASPYQADLREAARLDSQGKCREASSYYERALAAGPPSSALLNNLGNHHLLCGKPDQAREYFERLLKMRPDHANARLQLARIAVDQKNGGKALTYLTGLADADPAVVLVRAEALHLAGSVGESLELMATLEKRAGGEPRLLFAVGTLYARVERYDQAERVFQSLLSGRPGDYELLYSLGRVAARAGHHDRARSSLEAALRVRPDSVDVLLELGLSHAASHDYSRAVFLLAQARKKAPRRTDVLLALARAAEDAGYFGDSALAYDEYLALNPEDSIARRDRAHVLAETGSRTAEGLQAMAEYITAHPDDPVGYFNLAQFTWRTDPDESLQQLAKAIQLNPRFAPAHMSRAWLLHRLGRSEEAVPHLVKALEVTPQNVRALDQLGVAYLALDQAAKAEEPLRKAVAIAPDDPEVLLHLGRSLIALGRDEEAQRFIEHYQQMRPRRFRDMRREPGMIELATLSASERRTREIERFRSLAQSRPDDPLLQMHLANLLLADDQEKESIQEFRRLLTLNGDAAIWAESGRNLLRAGKHELAAEFLQRAVPERPEAQVDLASAVFHTSGPDAALALIGKASPAIPDASMGDLLLLKAKILDAAGRTGEAQEVLTKGIAMAPVRSQVIQSAAELLVQYHREQEALDLLGRALQSEPSNGELLLLHAVVLALLPRQEEADRQFREIQTRWPEWDRPYVAHALFLEQAARKEEASRMLRAAQALRSNDAAVSCILSRLSGSPLSRSACPCPTSLAAWLLAPCAR